MELFGRKLLKPFEFPLNLLDSTFIKELETQLKVEREALLNSSSVQKQETLNKLNVEFRILGPQLESLFSLPNLHKDLRGVVNKNLEVVLARVFDPIQAIKGLGKSNFPSRDPPFFNKFYYDLSTEGLNVLETPLEAVFVTLSKISWNEKLNLNKRENVRKMCVKISELDIPLEPSAEQLKNQKLLLENHNLLCIRQIYQNLFEMLSLA